jgi:hypothetical protein
VTCEAARTDQLAGLSPGGVAHIVPSLQPFTLNPPDYQIVHLRERRRLTRWPDEPPLEVFISLVQCECHRSRRLTMRVWIGSLAERLTVSILSPHYLKVQSQMARRDALAARHRRHGDPRLNEAR